jgi:hypothetical protein
MRFSASQISEYELCNRKWGWHKLDKIPCPSGPSAQLGNDIHEFLEGGVTQMMMTTPWTQYQWPDHPYTRLTQPGRALWPPMVNPKTEQEFVITLGGHEFLGYVDLTWMGDVPAVLDHKTTGNLRNAKSADKLKKDVQATLYIPAAHEIWGTPGPIAKAPVDLYWIYYQTKGDPGAKKTHLRVTMDDVVERIGTTMLSADRMAVAKLTNKRARDLEPNWSSCNAFGQPCPYKTRCYLEEKMGKADDILNNLRAQGDAKETAAQSVNPPAAEKPRTLMSSLSESLDKPKTKTDPPDEKPPAPEKEEKKSPKSPKKTTLYIDCFPTKGSKQPIDASEYIERAQATLETPHYKLEDYGKGAGLFALALRKLIDADGLPETVFLSLGTTEGRDAAQVFISYASTVIRGCPK